MPAKIINKIKNKISPLNEYKLFKRKTLNSQKDNGKNVFFKFIAYTPNRRLLQLVFHFLYSGYNCYIDISFLKFLKLGDHARYTMLLDGVFQYNKKKNINYSITVSDNNEFLNKFNPDTFKIYLNYLILENRFKNINDVNENDFFYPIGLHKTYLNKSCESDVLNKALNGNRKIGAVFAGNVMDDKKRNYYNMDITKKYLEINTRKEVFNYILNNLPKDILYTPNNLESFLKDLQEGILINKVVLLNTEIFKIPKEIYFNILLNSNFYIHMCGFIQPYCHNQMESKLAGCIPVTQFARFFVPPYSHEKNGLLYNTLEELLQLLRNISSGKYSDYIISMRNEIVNYYINYYSLDSFKNKLDSLIKKNIKDTNYYILT